MLGFDGVQQYERLREHAQASQKDSTSHDGFHNGIYVLDEVLKWHDYLRGHLRVSDTTTPSVLGLVEEYMLQAEPSRHHDNETLCMELQAIVHHAAWETQSPIRDFGQLERFLDDICILEADAQEKQSRSRFKPIPLQRQFAAMTEVKKPKQTQEVFGTTAEVFSEQQPYLPLTNEGEPRLSVTEETSRFLESISSKFKRFDSSQPDESLKESSRSSQERVNAQAADELDEVPIDPLSHLMYERALESDPSGHLSMLLTRSQKRLSNHSIGSIEAIMIEVSASAQDLSIESISWNWHPMIPVLRIRCH